MLQVTVKASQSLPPAPASSSAMDLDALQQQQGAGDDEEDGGAALCSTAARYLSSCKLFGLQVRTRYRGQGACHQPGA